VVHLPSFFVKTQALQDFHLEDLQLLVVDIERILIIPQEVLILVQSHLIQILQLSICSLLVEHQVAEVLQMEEEAEAEQVDYFMEQQHLQQQTIQLL
jgi:hypothetical protein